MYEKFLKINLAGEEVDSIDYQQFCAQVHPRDPQDVDEFKVPFPQNYLRKVIIKYEVSYRSRCLGTVA